MRDSSSERPDWEKRLEEAFDTIVEFMGRDGDLTPADRANYADTPARAARALAEMTLTRTDIIRTVNGLIERSFPMEQSDEAPGLITQGPIDLVSLCPHHLLTVEIKAYVAYLPSQGGRVLGLSKLARLAVELSKRPVLQEQLANDIADVLYKRDSSDWPGFDSDGAAVLLVGRHNCMCSRGIKSNALTTVSVMRGVFMTDSSFEGKFWQYVNACRKTSFGG